MTRLTSWWRELSAPAKFRLYSQLTLQGVVVVVAIVAAIGVSDVGWLSAAVVVSGLAALAAVQAQPELAAWTDLRTRRWAVPVATTTLAAVAVACGVAANLTDDESTVDAARTAGSFAVLLAGLAVVPFLRHRWWIVLVVGLASGVGFGGSVTGGLRVAAATGVLAALLVATTLLTLWGLRVVDELDRAKNVEARLQVAEERLRFSRDLHDVVGRGFSAVAVKSELAATLVRAGATDRAATEMDEVKALAVNSMDQMRELVRGYRDINLDGEVAGARSLLAAAGCDLVVEGDPARVPVRLHEVAAWVVREGTTNIVKHSSATSATIALGAAGMSLRNNGAEIDAREPQDEGQQSGLRGLSERLAPHGATLTTTVTDSDFGLEIRWEEK